MSENRTGGANRLQTLCWDCANAIGNCSWSDHNEHKPVDGWNAIKTRIRVHNPSCDAEETTSYIVVDCPEFVRDGEGHGVRRPGRENKIERRTDVDEDEVILAYKCGVRIQEIEETTGASEATIRRILRDAGIARNRKQGRRKNSDI